MRHRQRIAELVPDLPAHLVEAWMRSEHGTLDHLSEQAFRRAVMVAADMVRDFPDESTALAKSYGLADR